MFGGTMLFDPSLNFVPQSETIESQNAHISNPKLRHQTANCLTQKFRRLAGGNIQHRDFSVIAVDPR